MRTIVSPFRSSPGTSIALALLCLAWISPAPATPTAYAGLAPSAYERVEVATPTALKSGQWLTLQRRPGDARKAAAGADQRFAILRSHRHANGDRTVTARATDSGAVLKATIGENGVFGTLHERGIHRILTTEASGSWLVTVPATGMVHNLCGLEDQAAPPRPRSDGKQAPASKALDEVLDVLVIYTPGFEARYPGSLSATRINHFMAIANETLANSFTDLATRLVGIRRVAYTDGNSNQVARDNMAAALAPPFQAAAGLANLNDFREETGADLVIMVRPHDIELRGSCGIAYFPDGNPALGVNVVSDGMSSWSLCSDDVLIHEIGHNLGAGHQIGFGGGFFDARGSAFVRSGQFNTTMGSFGTGRPDRFRGLFMFSNPDADCGGTPCGTFNENNSAVLRQVAPAVASYRSAVSSVPMPDELDRSASDMDGDGVVDWSDPFPFDPAEQADGDGDGVGDNADLFPANAQESGDNDGDGVGDSVDPDDDDDGRSDFSDAFPFDPAEQDDSDFDGTGDVADARPGDRAEFRDTDGDGDGDNLDRDDDGDGFDELSVTDLDLLVISVGNSRILRFDAATGQARGIEVLPEDGLLTFQSDLAWRDSDNSLLYLSDSSIRRASLLDRTPLGTYVVAYDDSNSRPQLGTGFPTGLAAIPRDQARSVGEYYFAYGTSANVTFGEGAERALFGFDRFQLQGADLARDLTNDGGDVLALGRNRALYRGTGFASFQEPMTVLAGPGASWMSAPQRMAVHPDGRILISDTGRNAVLAADGDSGEFLGVVADVAAAGYSRPTGVAVNTDGETLVAVADQSAVLRFGIDGDFLGELVPAGSGGLSEPWAMITVPALVDRYPRDPERVIRPNAGLWFNPATNGRGFDIEVFGNVLTAIWYAYDEDGNPLWYYSQGTLTGFEYSGTLAIARLLEDGFEFEDIGTLSLSFFSERQAELSWTIDGEDGEETGGEPLQWLAFSNEPAPADYTGLWGRPDGPGWGISLATQGETTVALAFIYDDAGDPRWVISDPVTGDSPFAFDMFAAFSDTLCPTCSGAPDFERVSAGTMDITVPAVGAWSSEVTWPSPLPGQWLLDGTELVRFSEEPDRPR